MADDDPIDRPDDEPGDDSADGGPDEPAEEPDEPTEESHESVDGPDTTADKDDTPVDDADRPAEDAAGDGSESDGTDETEDTWDDEHDPPNEDPDIPADDVDAVDAPESRRDDPKSLGERLHEFAVDLLDSGTTSGEHRGGRISYGYSARTGPTGPSGPAAPHRRRRPSRGSAEPSGTDAHASVVRDGDDLRVTVDLPGVAPEDLTCGVDPDRDELVVGADGRVLSRVPLEGTDHVVAASLNNHVLTVHLTDQ